MGSRRFMQRPHREDLIPIHHAHAFRRRAALVFMPIEKARERNLQSLRLPPCPVSSFPLPLLVLSRLGKPSVAKSGTDGEHAPVLTGT